MDDRPFLSKNRMRLKFYIKTVLADLTNTRQADDAELQRLATFGHIEKHCGRFVRNLLLQIDPTTVLHYTMNHFPSQWGKPRQENVDEYNTVPLYNNMPESHAAAGPMTRTQ